MAEAGGPESTSEESPLSAEPSPPPAEPSPPPSEPSPPPSEPSPPAERSPSDATTLAPAFASDEPSPPRSPSGRLGTSSSGRITALLAGKPPPPDYVGGFRIFSSLSPSVLGRVYSASRDGEATVELRLLERDDPALMTRVKLALDALAQVDHPNVARVVASGTDAGIGYYALAVPECATLLDLVRRGRPLDGAEIAWVGAGLSSALAALHEKGLPHGDVTPVNVGIGRDGTVTLVDLGWAPRVRDPDLGSRLAEATAQDVGQLAATLIFATTGQAVKARSGKPGETTASNKRLSEKASWLTPVIVEILESLQSDLATRPTAAEAARRFRLAGEDSGLKTWAPPPDFIEAAQNLLANRSAGSDKTTASSQTGVAGAPALGSFGRYILLEEVARGGMGVVYRARHSELDRFFALKVLLSGDLASDVTRRRFLREAEAAAQLDHPSIVRVHDFGEHGGRAYIAMDFASGKSLSHMLPDPKVPLERLLHLFAKVADAVHYAHSRGIIHRDLKPQNIVVDEVDLPHILDFGVAKRLDEEARTGKAGAGLTTEGELVGTPAYMPPEQAEGRAKDIDTRSDVYALGVVLYEVASRGRLPFEGLTVTDVLTKVLLEDPQPPSIHRHGLPWEVDAIVLKAIEKDPRKRYQSAAELAQDVRRYLEGHPIGARPANAVYRAQKWARRNRRTLPFMAVAVCAVAAIPVFVARAHENEAEQNRRNVEKLLADGDAFLKDGKLVEANDKYTAAYGIDPGSRRAFEGKTRVEDRLNRENEEKEARKLAAEKKEQARTLVLEGKTKLAAKDVEAARKAFFGSLALDAGSEGALAGILDTNRLAFKLEAEKEAANQRARDKEASSRLVAEGKTALGRQDAEAARRAFFQALGFDKESAEAQEGLRRADEITYKAESARDAAKLRESAVAEAQRLTEAGKAELAKGELGTARERFIQAVAFDGTNKDALDGLSQVDARESERISKADRQRKQVEAQKLVSSGDDLLKKARELQAGNEERSAVREAYYKAMEAFDRASFLSPDDPAISGKKAGAAIELAKIAKAQQEFGLSDYLYRIAGTLADAGTDHAPEEATDGCIVVREADAILANRAFHEALVYDEKATLEFLSPVSEVLKPWKGRLRLRIDVRTRVVAGPSPSISCSGVTLYLEDMKNNTTSAPERIDFDGDYSRITVAGTTGRAVPSFDKALRNDAPAFLEKIKAKAQALVDKQER